MHSDYRQEAPNPVYRSRGEGVAHPVARQREDDAAGGAAGQAGAHQALYQLPAHPPSAVLRQHRHVHYGGRECAVRHSPGSPSRDVLSVCSFVLAECLLCCARGVERTRREPTTTAPGSPCQAHKLVGRPLCPGRGRKSCYYCKRVLQGQSDALRRYGILAPCFCPQHRYLRSTASFGEQQTQRCCFSKLKGAVDRDVRCSPLQATASLHQ